MKVRQRRWLWLILILTLFIVTGCQKSSSQPQATQPKLQIVTSTPTYAQLARQIAGSHAQVQSLITNPNADPHDFEATTQDAKIASQAKIAVYNGLGYDSWMDKLLVDNQQVQAINVGQVMHKSVGANPHIWYDPQALAQTAVELTQKLSRQMPQYRQVFEQNQTRYLKTLAPLQTQLHQIKAQRTKKLVAVSEPVFDYSLHQMGYQVANKKFAKAIEEGSDPTPQAVQALQRLITQQKIAFFVVNQQTTNTVVDNLVQLAQKHHVPIVKVTETQPAHLTYQEWMQRQYHQVQKIEAQAHE